MIPATASPTWSVLERRVLIGWCVLVGAVFVAHADEPSIWFDELASLRFSRQSWSQWLRTMALGEANGGLHHLTLRFVTPVFGDGLLALRLPSILAWVGALPLFHALARRVAPAWPALAATVAFSLAPLGLHHGIEARMYAYVTAATILATLTLVRFVERSTSGRAVVYGMAAAAAIGCHFMALPVIAAQGLAILAHRERRLLLRRIWPAALLIAPAALVVAEVARRNGARQISWIAPSNARETVEVLVALVNVAPPPDRAWALLVAVPTLVLVGFGLWSATRNLVSSGRADAEPVDTSPSAAAGRFLAGAVALWLVVPVATVLLVSWTVQPMLTARYLIVALPAAVLLALLGALRLDALLAPRTRHHRAVPIALAATAVAVTGPGLVTTFTSPYFGEDWRAASTLVADGFRDGDLVLVADTTGGELGEQGFWYHLPDDERERMAGRVLRADEVDRPPPRPPAGRIWLVQRPGASGIDGQVDAALDAIVVDVEEVTWWDDGAVQVARFEPAP